MCVIVDLSAYCTHSIPLLFAVPSSSDVCGGCGISTGPCVHDNDGTCLNFMPGTSICGPGTHLCSGVAAPNTCDNCFSGTSGPCQDENGVCYGFVTGTTTCPGTSLSCAAISGFEVQQAAQEAGTTLVVSIAVAGATRGTFDQPAVEAALSAIAGLDVSTLYLVSTESGVVIGVSIAAPSEDAAREAANALAAAAASGELDTVLVNSGLDNSHSASVAGEIVVVAPEAAAAQAAAPSAGGQAGAGAAASGTGSSMMVALVVGGVLLAVLLIAAGIAIVKFRARQSGKVRSIRVTQVTPSQRALVKPTPSGNSVSAWESASL